MRKLITCLMLLSALSSAETPLLRDPFLGKWTLDVKHSKYQNKDCPRRMTIEMSAEAQDGVHYHSETQYANGKETTADYTAVYDGPTVIVEGAPGLLLPVALKRENPRTVLASYSRGFRVKATSRRVISGDGRRMVITTKSESESGKVITNIGVYLRS